MQKTVISHFYNEEWLLPYWLTHHKQIFDHGILIDYNSSDRSREIIKEICPSWTIVTSVNHNFDDVNAIDDEVRNYEAKLTGWRMTLNTTEFLIGNYARLQDTDVQTRIYVGQYMLVDMERADEPATLSPLLPIWQQRRWGYGIVSEYKRREFGSIDRPPRSVHNYAASYPTVGRHFWHEKHTYDDLVIFYCGYASIEEASLARRLQIQTQILTKPTGGGPGSHHVYTKEKLLTQFRKEQQPRSQDLTQEIEKYVNYHKNLSIIF